MNASPLRKTAVSEFEAPVPELELSWGPLVDRSEGGARFGAALSHERSDEDTRGNKRRDNGDECQPSARVLRLEDSG
jgi:hypothetical protein